MRNTRIINLYGGPDAGKSTAMADTFVALKRRGRLVEMAHEWVKLPVWAGHTHVLEDQLYIFAKNNRQLRQLNGAVDFVVNDSPLLLSLVYGDMRGPFRDLVLETHRSYRNINVFIERMKPYDPAGRVQDEAKALSIDQEIKDMLIKCAGECTTIRGDSDAGDLIADLAEAEWM